MKKQNSYFEVDNEGMKRLYEGQPRSFILRELLQNAFDENIKKCSVSLDWQEGIATIIVEDDSPEGFKDLADAYTLYKHTSKRGDASKRGRFNLGEKQVISQCELAIIKTTKGQVTFSKKDGRILTKRIKTKAGSVVHLIIKMKKVDFLEIVDFCHKIYIPENIEFSVQVDSSPTLYVKYKKPFRSFTATLPTVLDDGISFGRTQRKTIVNVYQKTETINWLYELGLPVCEIDCDYDIDVQQKVPLSEDRNSVSPAFLKRLYAEVLNQVHDDVSKEDASRVWVRTATKSDAIADDVAKEIFTKRFGDKALVANPNDPRSMDEAISRGYNVIYGREMDKDEWSRFKGVGMVKSTSALFGTSEVGFTPVSMSEISDIQKRIAKFAQKIAQKTFGIYVAIEFIRSPDATTCADYNRSNRKIRFNLSNIPKQHWVLDSKDRLHQEMHKLIVHEIAHEKGTHYESAYHEAINNIQTQLLYLKDENPDWFKF